MSRPARRLRPRGRCGHRGRTTPRRPSIHIDPGLPRHTTAYLHEKGGDSSTAARLYADAARSAPNLAERHHLTRQAARISQALRG
jgi:hypothetical protein